MQESLQTLAQTCSHRPLLATDARSIFRLDFWRGAHHMGGGHALYSELFQYRQHPDRRGEPAMGCLDVVCGAQGIAELAQRRGCLMESRICEFICTGMYLLLYTGTAVVQSGVRDLGQQRLCCQHRAVQRIGGTS